MQQRKYFIKTYGCQMNVHDSERMAGMLESMGYQPGNSEEEANFVLLNTCSVREKADQKLFTKLGRLNKLRKGAQEFVIAVAGCIAQRAADEILQRAPFVDIVLGPRAVSQLPNLIEKFYDTGEKQICTDLPEDFDNNRVYVRNSSVLGYVTIMEGCNKFCSYCIVPFTRGREVSKPVDMVMDEVNDLAVSSYREIHLLGQNVNAYNDENSQVDFAELLRRVSDVDEIKRIRFITSYPNHLTDEIIDVIAERSNICNAIHLPPQSGSSRILKEMRRRYTREEYLERIDRLKEKMPDIALSGDIIVGFPGETEDDFLQTLDLLERVEFASLFSFVFSPRPGTKAEHLEDNVPKEVKVERLQHLQQMQSRIQFRKHLSMVGKEADVLFDGVSPKKDGQIVGRTEGNLVVNMYGDKELIGKLQRVRITEAGPHSLKAEPADILTKGRA